MPDAAYLNVRPHAEVCRTVSVGRGVLVDLDADGLVLGVENIAGPVDMGALLAALAAARFPSSAGNEVSYG